MSLQEIINEYVRVYKLGPLLYSDDLFKTDLSSSAKFKTFVEFIITYHAMNNTKLSYKVKYKDMYQKVREYIEPKVQSQEKDFPTTSTIVSTQVFEILFKSLHHVFFMYAQTIRNLDTKVLQNSVHKYLSNNAHMTLYLMFYNTNIMPLELTQKIISQMSMNTIKNDNLLKKCKEFFY